MFYVTLFFYCYTRILRNALTDHGLRPPTRHRDDLLGRLLLLQSDSLLDRNLVERVHRVLHALCHNALQEHFNQNFLPLLKLCFSPDLVVRPDPDLDCVVNDALHSHEDAHDDDVGGGDGGVETDGGAQAQISGNQPDVCSLVQWIELAGKTGSET